MEAASVRSKGDSLEPKIRRATFRDVLGIGLIERESFADPWGSREFTSALEAQQAIFLVAEDAAGVVTGYAIAITVMDEAGSFSTRRSTKSRRGARTRYFWKFGNRIIPREVSTLRAVSLKCRAGADTIAVR
jgi:hypothetical protein